MRVAGVDGGGASADRVAKVVPLDHGADNVTADIVSRIHLHAKIPESYGEPLQVSRYRPGGRYELHYDSTRRLGRQSTFLLYLNTLEPADGGQTVFPNAGGGAAPAAAAPPFGDRSAGCPDTYAGGGGLSVRPRAGDAIHFFNHLPDLSLDRLSLHGSCPTLAADKWIAQRWIRRTPGRK
eukprot:TRINITY_DN12053_c0_g2_i1.p2 TRINITY_DN12053_c0_g2~~TRINITY_DN12053_c0_g2_i1.p2  ORF type:complete len:180 (+),score=18.30 TRINITY_DN12053_c0_g2_i1:280-819(+)